MQTTSRRIGVAMAVEAATFLIASAIHFGTGFDGAAVPELLIAAVLGLAAAVVLRRRRADTWGVAVGATAFATFGTIVGLTIIATGRQDAPDLAYHSAILTALTGTLTILLARRRPVRGPRPIAQGHVPDHRPQAGVH